MAEQIELRMDKMVYGGACLARREDGKAVFVPFSLPGELVTAEIVEEHKGHANARLVKVVEPSTDRIEPQCKHFMECGGCQYQHISYEKQLEYKQQIFADQLTRLGGVSDPNVSLIVASDSPWKYRIRAQFHQNEEGRLGFQAAGSNLVVLIEECHLLSEGISELWPQLEMEYIPEVQRIEFREGDDEHMMIVFQSEDPVPPEMELDLDAAVVHLGPDGPMVMADSLFQYRTIAGKTFRIAAPSFFQVNPSVAEKLVELVLAHAGETDNKTLFDLFSGVGLFSAFLADKVGELLGVESSEFACEDFSENLDAFENISLYQDDAGRALAGITEKPDVVLVDPPRSGLSRQLRDRIIEKEPGKILYISCDPSTLARDIKRFLQAGYTLKESIPLDMFPQTRHIESLTVLEL